MNTIPSRYDSVCCGAVGSSPSHRPGCRFEVAAEIQKSHAAREARQVINDYNDTSKVISFLQVMNALTRLSLTVETYAIGIAP